MSWVKGRKSVSSVPPRLPVLYAGTTARLSYCHSDLIAADLIYIPLYVVKRLDLTALVYVLLLCLCAAGVRRLRPGEPFTLADLRRVYDAVWGSAPHLASFRRKVLGTEGFVVEAQRSPPMAAAGAAGGRPPLLYRRGPATTLHPPLLRPSAS